MKPTKNRIHCVACGRSKMLFKSEEEALRFIEFNASEIKRESGKAPIRAYYCKACGGWHVTSHERSQSKLQLNEALRHLSRLKKYLRKEKLSKANMEYSKTYRFLTQAVSLRGDDSLKEYIFQELENCQRQYISMAA